MIEKIENPAKKGRSMGVTYLDDEISLRITSHTGELCSKLLELGSTVCVNHPA